MKTALVGTPTDQRLKFWCPACADWHQPRVAGVQPWEWDGERERPTLRPSVKVTWPDGKGGALRVCHFFLTAGHLHYCEDSTHVLAGKVVALLDLLPE